MVSVSVLQTVVCPADSKLCIQWSKCVGNYFSSENLEVRVKLWASSSTFSMAWLWAGSPVMLDLLFNQIA